MIETLAEWNSWWSSGKVDGELVGRERELSKRAEDFLTLREIKTIMGVRRSGKSTILYQFIDCLLRQKKVDPKTILLVNFEDNVLSKHTLSEIFDKYQANVNPDAKPYLFLDEVHRCAEWALFVRKLYDLRKAEQIFVTDSTSEFIRAEYASALTGREVNLMVFPLSFGEYAEWKGVRTSLPLGRDDVNRLLNALGSYLRWGGFPEVFLKSSEMHKKMLLNDYLNDIVHKDIVERYNANAQKVKGLVDYLVSNAGALFSPRKYSRTYGLSLDSINTYSWYLQDTFLFYPVAKFDYSIRKQQLSPKKMYICDLGLFCNAGFNFTENLGRLYESVVFMDLKRKGKEIYYWKGNSECDFVVKRGAKISAAIQVCYKLEPESRKREVKGLIEAMDALKIKEGMIINENHEGAERIGKKTVRYMPLWKYLLS